MPSAARQFCDDCLPDERRQIVKGFLRPVSSRLRACEPRVATRWAMRERGERSGRPMRGDAARKSSGIDAREPDPEVFARESIAATAGRVADEDEGGDGAVSDDVCEDTCGHVPHPRHWDNLRRVCV